MLGMGFYLTSSLGGDAGMLGTVGNGTGSLAPGYQGEVCIGCLVRGKSRGEEREVFVYSTCEHAECYRDIGAQAISYTTAVPMVSAALLVARGEWNVGRLVNVEELDPDPFMALMPEVGIDWDVREA